METLHIKPLTQTIGQGFLAVPIFFLLSGFVIAYLEDYRRERYGLFLIRRFFRLAPVYYLSLAFGIVDAVHTGVYGDRLWEHIVMHLTMLHGLPPMAILPGSASALDVVSWSVSVEWQFYLIAPFLLLGARKSGGMALGLLAFFAGALFLIGKVPILAYDDVATVFHRAGVFAVGIGSFFLFKFATTHVELVKGCVPYLLPFGLAFSWICGGPIIHTGPIWIILFSSVLVYYCGIETWITKPVRLALRLPIMVWLGRLSYCTYLCHSRVIEAFDRLVSQGMGFHSPWARFGLLLLVGFPLLALISEIVHRLIEKPGIQFGKWLVSRLDPAPPIATVQEEGAGRTTS